MEPSRADIRTWLQGVLARTGEKPSQLAVRAGLAASTITRFLADDAASMLSMRSLAKIAHAAGVEPIGMPATTPRGGLAEREAAPYVTSPQKSSADRAVEALIAGRQGVDPWTLRSGALGAVGYLPGDVLIVDLNAAPVAGDVVCAQSYVWEDRTAETVFRVYEPPYLLAAPLEPDAARALRRPLVVDGDRVLIKGVVIAALRLRNPKA